jgi:hypothetical protein
MGLGPFCAAVTEYLMKSMKKRKRLLAYGLGGWEVKFKGFLVHQPKQKAEGNEITCEAEGEPTSDAHSLLQPTTLHTRPAPERTTLIHSQGHSPHDGITP